MAVQTNYYKIDHKLANAENTFNKLGYIPVVSTLSGLARAVTGIFQKIISTILCVSYAIKYVFTKNLDDRKMSAECFWHIRHGHGNILRGLWEMIPFVGNAATLTYDKAIKLRMNYTTEQLPSGRYPIFDPRDAQA